LKRANKMLNKLKPIVLLSVFIVGHVFAQNVEKSWEDAVVYIPGKIFTTSVNKIAVDKPMPVVIYLHGCAGLNRVHDAAWGSFIADQGFIVIQPDSMATPGRISNCSAAAKKSTHAFPQAHKYRQLEIDYALEKIQTSSWADKQNIFIMGHSEGGVAIAIRKNHTGLAGGIISGWTCTSYVPEFQGIASPKETPTLVIASVDDDWRKGTALEGNCANFAEGRSNFKQVDLPGTDHATAGQAEARRAVKEFLNQYQKK